MRLPYLQLANDLIEHAADLAVELDVPEEKAGWGLVKLIAWALSRCPDDAPPSHNDVVTGPSAAKLIARAAGFPVADADRFVTACEQLQPKPILERVPGGIRVRGLDRYDQAWGKNHPELWRELRRTRNETGPKPERVRTETGAPDQDPDPDPDPDQEVDSKPPPTPSAPVGALAAVVEASVVEPDVTGIPRTVRRPAVEWRVHTEAGCWEMLQLERELRGLEREARRPAKFSAWFARALSDAGPEAIQEIFRAWLDDPHVQKATRPVAAFIGGTWEARWQARSAA